ncbi:hypothetical protein WMF30_40105 [Sorangium sp. So ce134]
MSWITDKLLGLRRIVFGSETKPERGTIEFAGGVTVEDDAVNKRTVVTVTGGGGTTNAEVSLTVNKGADASADADFWAVIVPPVSADYEVLVLTIIPRFGIDGDPTNNATIRFWTTQSNPDDAVLIAEFSTEEALPYGSVQAIDLASPDLPTGWYLYVTIEKNGSGVELPDMAFSVRALRSE